MLFNHEPERYMWDVILDILKVVVVRDYLGNFIADLWPQRFASLYII